jgi:hypothetical protein
MTRRLWLGTAVPAPFVSFASAPFRSDAARMMADAAGNFLAALTAEQRQRATFAFDNEERFNWHFVPRERKGLPLREMTVTQRHLAYALLAAGLSQRGLIKAASVMSLEEVLKVIENDSGERRNPEKYYFTVFGAPSDEKPWGWRVEGHHLSLNFTLAGGRVTGSPSFFGANPAEVRHGPRKGLRVLATEEDLGRDLLGALTPAQRDTAIVDEKAYPDILTGASRKAALEGKPDGLAAAKMTAKQRDLLAVLVTEYARNFPEAIAEARIGKYRAAGGDVWFAWAGTPDRGGPHYYRVQGPAFLVEYDNTQNQANHIHSVWRDLDEGDWGLDLLKRHYATAAPGHGHG